MKISKENALGRLEIMRATVRAMAEEMLVAHSELKYASNAVDDATRNALYALQDASIAIKEASEALEDQ